MEKTLVYKTGRCVGATSYGISQMVEKCRKIDRGGNYLFVIDNFCQTKGIMSKMRSRLKEIYPDLGFRWITPFFLETEWGDCFRIGTNKNPEIAKGRDFNAVVFDESFDLDYFQQICPTIKEDGNLIIITHGGIDGIKEEEFNVVKL